MGDVALVSVEGDGPGRICAFAIAADGVVTLVPGLSSCVPTVQGVEPAEELALGGDQVVLEEAIRPPLPIVASPCPWARSSRFSVAALVCPLWGR